VRLLVLLSPAQDYLSIEIYAKNYLSILTHRLLGRLDLAPLTGDMAEPIPLVSPSPSAPVPPVLLASPSPVIPGMSSVVSLPNAIPSNGTTIPVVPPAPSIPAQNTSVGLLGVPGNTITLTSTLSVTSSLSAPQQQDSEVVPPLPVPIAVVSSSAVPSQDRPNMDQVISSDRARESSLAGVVSPSQVSLPVTSSTAALSLTLQM
jgi:hypothetical protein